MKLLRLSVFGLLLAAFIGCTSQPEGVPQPRPNGSGGRGTSPGQRAHQQNQDMSATH